MAPILYIYLQTSLLLTAYSVLPQALLSEDLITFLLAS